MNNIAINSTVQKSTTSTSIINESNYSVLPYDCSVGEFCGTVFIMAKAFLSISEMTHKKLQKLCYYAKAWYLALYDQNIISDPFEAWVHGAVQPSLYQSYKRYGFSTIPRETNIMVISSEYLSFAKEIYDSYGDLTGDELETLNHSEMPWINARKGLKPWENCHNVISELDMKNYYRTMIDA